MTEFSAPNPESQAAPQLLVQYAQEALRSKNARGVEGHFLPRRRAVSSDGRHWTISLYRVLCDLSYRGIWTNTPWQPS